MWHLLNESNRSEILRYISKEPEVNLYISGDIEAYGVKDPVVVASFGADETTWDAIVLGLNNNFVIYSQSGDFDVQEVSNFIVSLAADGKPRHLNARLDIARKISPFFPDYSLEQCRLARCTPVNHDITQDLPESVEIRMVQGEDYDLLFDALETVENTTHVPRGSSEREEEKARKASASKVGCFTVGIFQDDRLLSTAGISSASKQGAMLTGVATRPDERGKGLATAAVYATCNECFRRGMDYVALYYTNPVAARIYKRIGFEDVADFGMLSRIEKPEQQ